MRDEILQLKEYIQRADNIVFFGGAGVSTESGIPDFRSVDGLYNQKYKYPPETILSHDFLLSKPEEYYAFHREKLNIKGVLPNKAHLKLAELEGSGRLRAVVTQNIDGLHQAAGSRNVLELHGSAMRFYCIKCKKSYDNAILDDTEGVPYCGCGGLIRPDVVLYGEQLDQRILRRSIACIEEAQLLIVGGTSLNVYPAAGLLDYFNGEHIVLLNRDPTSYDGRASLVISSNIGEVLGEIDAN